MCEICGDNGSVGQVHSHSDEKCTQWRTLLHAHTYISVVYECLYYDTELHCVESSEIHAHTHANL